MKFKVFNPFNNQVVSTIYETKKVEIQNILSSLYGSKFNLSVKKRKSIFNNANKILKSEKRSLTKLISSEVGVSLKDAEYEVERVINCTLISKKVCNLIEKDQTKHFDIQKNSKSKMKVISEPLDLVIAFTPFNLPMILAAHKIFPAIISGTPLVLKPSEETPNSAKKLLQILIKSGLPKNMIKIIYGFSGEKVLNEIIKFKRFDLINFTGSSEVGRKIKKKLIQNNLSLKKTMMELGGNSPVIICKDCNLNLAVKIVIDGCFKYSGQRCTSARRIIIENSIADRFLKNLLIETKKIKYGNPFDSNNQMGSMINLSAASKVRNKINKAIKKGAKLIFGNKQNGAVISPTILDKVKSDMSIVKGETFGPVCSIIRSKSFKDSLRIASKSNFKMAGSIVSKDFKKALVASNFLKFGQFSFNGTPGYRTEAAPFGGFEDSGDGEKEGLILASRMMRRTRVLYKH